MEGKPARKRKRPRAAPRGRSSALEAKLPLGRALLVERGQGGALVSIREPAGRVELELEIAVTKEGPRVRVRAAALEIEATERITARCKEFHVEAQERIELHAGGQLVQRAAEVSLEATTGGVRVDANDDVALHGEHVLLNCDPVKPLPSWVPVLPERPSPVPVETASGDAELLARIATER